jgi:hypothetical protein
MRNIKINKGVRAVLIIINLLKQVASEFLEGMLRKKSKCKQTAPLCGFYLHLNIKSDDIGIYEMMYCNYMESYVN